ncbi:hypothetical protein HKX48_002065 [Thoreauomyces humboldtii]|nr:hypothetical protein HKX48_002065 [Thoreauomyces humboldtii]
MPSERCAILVLDRIRSCEDYKNRLQKIQKDNDMKMEIERLIRAEEERIALENRLKETGAIVVDSTMFIDDATQILHDTKKLQDPIPLAHQATHILLLSSAVTSKSNITDKAKLAQNKVDASKNVDKMVTSIIQLDGRARSVLGNILSRVDQVQKAFLATQQKEFSPEALTKLEYAYQTAMESIEGQLDDLAANNVRALQLAETSFWSMHTVYVGLEKVHAHVITSTPPEPGPKFFDRFSSDALTVPQRTQIRSDLELLASCNSTVTDIIYGITDMKTHIASFREHVKGVNYGLSSTKFQGENVTDHIDQLAAKVKDLRAVMKKDLE